jgi:hypothetical protein
VAHSAINATAATNKMAIPGVRCFSTGSQMPI